MVMHHRWNPVGERNSMRWYVSAIDQANGGCGPDAINSSSCLRPRDSKHTQFGGSRSEGGRYSRIPPRSFCGSGPFAASCFRVLRLAEDTYLRALVSLKSNSGVLTANL